MNSVHASVGACFRITMGSNFVGILALRLTKGGHVGITSFLENCEASSGGGIRWVVGTMSGSFQVRPFHCGGAEDYWRSFDFYIKCAFLCRQGIYEFAFVVACYGNFFTVIGNVRFCFGSL